MAKIKYSALVSDMRNKLNGSVLSRNRYGSYIRNKVTPVNPQTQYQQQARALFSAASSAWAGLSTSQRKGFTELAEQHKYTDIFGDQKALDGKAMFVKLNSNLQWAGQEMIEDSPAFTDLEIVNIESAGIYLDSSGIDEFEIETDLQTLPANTTLFVYATPPLPPEINFVKNRLRLLGSFSITAGVVDIADAYQDRFGGDMGALSKVHLRLRVVSTASGQAGLPTSGIAPVL